MILILWMLVVLYKWIEEGTILGVRASSLSGPLVSTWMQDCALCFFARASSSTPPLLAVLSLEYKQVHLMALDVSSRNAHPTTAQGPAEGRKVWFLIKTRF